MTNEETKLAMPSAKKVIEVIKKLKYLDTGKVSQKEMQKQAQESIAKKEQGRYRLVYKKDKRTIVAEPRGYEWQPEWLDPLMFQNRLYWFKSSDESDRFKGWIFILSEGVEEAALHVPQKYCIPILGWQEIEKILEKLGYYVRVLRNVDKDSYGNHLCECAIDRNKGHIAKVVAKDRQTAVTSALLELEKELK